MHACSESSSATVGEQHDKNVCKVECSNYKYLEKAFEVVFHKIGEMMDRYEISDEGKEKFKTRFVEKYRCLINESITVKGFPWDVYKNLSMNTIDKKQKQDHFARILLPKMGNEITNTTAKRKQYPFQVCRIVQQKLKLERQNLKQQPISIQSSLNTNPSEISDWDTIEEKYNRFSSDVSTFQMNVQSQLDNIRKAQKNVSVIEEICSNQDDSTLLKTSGCRSVSFIPTWYQSLCDK